MLHKLTLAITILACFTFASFAADIDGHWVGSMSGPDGDMEIAFNFKVEGETVSGSVESPMGTVPISNGKISGETFSFDVVMDTMTITHNCTLQGETIDMKAQGPWGEMQLTLSRKDQ